MTDRTSIKTSREVFDRLNADRQDRGLTWDQYLRRLHDGERGDIDPEDIDAVAERISEVVCEDVREEVRSVVTP